MDVDAAGHKGCSRAEHDRRRVKRSVHGTVGRRLGLLSDLRRRRVLTLGESVDAVVKEEEVKTSSLI